MTDPSPSVGDTSDLDVRLRSGLRSSVDTPAPDQELPRAVVPVAGWIVHHDREVRAVIVEVDGRVEAFASVGGTREDVAAALPGFAGADTSGWSTTVDLTEHEGQFVTIAVSAVLGPRHPDRRTNLGSRGNERLLRFGSVTCRVDPKPVPLRASRLIQPGHLEPGLAVLGVVSETPGGPTSVEISLDGEPTSARVLLPGMYDGVVREPASLLGLAQAVLKVPEGVGEVRVGARVTGAAGDVIDVDEVTIPVITPAPPRERTGDPAVFQARVRDRVDRLGGLPGDGRHRILLLAHDLQLGGAQLYLQELVERMVAAGESGAVVAHGDGPLRERMEELGWPVLITGPLDVTSPSAVEGHELAVASWAAEHGCRVALANTIVTFPGVLAAQRAGLPVAWAIHESITTDEFWLVLHGGRRPHPDVEAGFERALEQADRVVFVAEATRAMYADRIAPNAGIVVPYGVDLDVVDTYVVASDRVALRAELGIPPSARLLLCLGTVEERKSPAMLAHAFLSSPVVRDSDLHLAIVGATANHYVDTLTRYLEEARTDRITLHPLDPDSNRWHLASDVLVSAADNESMPRTMIEAMAFGRPVAGTRVFGVPELVVDGESGFLCEPRDVLAMRAMLERVATASDDDLARMGRRGREKVLRDHHPRGYANFFLNEVDRLDKTFR